MTKTKNNIEPTTQNQNGTDGKNALVEATLAVCVVLASLDDDFQARCRRLEKKAIKHGMTVPTFTLDRVQNEKVYDDDRQIRGWRVWNIYNVSFPDLRMPGGWRFIGSIEHTKGGNIITTPATQAEEFKALGLESYRKTKPTCDHCGTNRRRNNTYLVANHAGEVRQVGKSCLKDFLGIDAARNIDLFKTIMDMGEEMESQGTGPTWQDLEDYVTICEASIQEFGWLSKGAALERGGEPTAEKVDRICYILSLYRKALDGAPEACRILAQQAIEWASTLPESTESDYLQNLKVIAQLPYIYPKHSGLAASIPNAYRRYLDDERRRLAEVDTDALAAAAGHFGQPSDKIGRKLTKKDKAKGITSHPELKVTLLFKTTIEGQWGPTTILKFQAESGHLFTWFASGTHDIKVDEKFSLLGTVKKHGDYKGVPTTILNRCALTPAQ